MRRQEDTGVTVNVRIKFLSQFRNTVDPNAPGAAPGTRPLGELLDDPTEIPAGDPRRDWAAQHAKDAVASWNGRLTLVGEEVNVFSGNTKTRLPVTFQSTPVFGLGDDADNVVIVHPPSTVAGTPGQPIDAGNWYMNKGSYAADDKVIAAHEYGHLIGIPDEYSQSNEQLNVLMHQAAPKDAASAMAALDQESVERMVLSSMRQPLYDQLNAVMPTIVSAFQAKRTQVKRKLAAELREGVKSAEVTDALRDQLVAASEGALAPAVPRVVAFETTTNFSNVTQAGKAFESVFRAGALTKQVRDAYWATLITAKAPVAMAGLGDVSINVASSVNTTTAAGGANVAAAAGLATSSVGPGAGTPALPAVVPGSSLQGRLMALPATWDAAGSLLETGVTAAAIASNMKAVLAAAAAVAAIAAVVPLPGLAAPTIRAKRDLYRRALQLVTNASAEAARQVTTDLVAASITPALTSSVADLEAAIKAEVSRVMTTPPAGVAALGPADPNMAALVGAMKTTLDANKRATAGTGRDPTGGGRTAPAQDVTYSYQGLMGSNKTMAVRPDQFDPMVAHFNDSLTSIWEKKFTADVK
jgi:hypothetical protein